MARSEQQMLKPTLSAAAQRPEALCEMGLAYATGSGCDPDLVSAHKWLNIAAIRGCDRAALLRADVAAAMTKMQLAEALRAAREWMTVH